MLPPGETNAKDPPYTAASLPVLQEDSRTAMIAAVTAPTVRARLVERWRVGTSGLAVSRMPFTRWPLMRLRCRAAEP